MVEAKKDHPLLFLWNLGTLGIYLIAFGRSGFSSTFGQGRFGLDRICLERPSGTLTALQAKSSVCNCWCILWRSCGYFIAVFFFFLLFGDYKFMCRVFVWTYVFISLREMEYPGVKFLDMIECTFKKLLLFFRVGVPFSIPISNEVLVTLYLLILSVLFHFNHSNKCNSSISLWF